MMKGRVLWVFWLLAVLAVITSTASYAWLSINLSATTSGIAVKLRTETEYLQISAQQSEGYKEEVSFGKESYLLGVSAANEVFLVTYGYLPAEGGLIITHDLITEETAESLGFTGGVYGGIGRVYRREASQIGIPDDAYSYVDITETLSLGDSVVGYYRVNDSDIYNTTASNGETVYHYRHEREFGIDYVCVGSFSTGDLLSNRMYWGYAISDDESSAQGERMLNIVSVDVPAEGFALHKTVYFRTANASANLSNLRIEEIKIEGLRNYLTDAMRILFVAKSSRTKEQIVTMYDYEHPEYFDGKLFGTILGNRSEIITVDVYIFFDGTHESTFTKNGVLSNHSVDVLFSVDKTDN